ncbi:MAG: FtsW/RodA/SpoVE family cell cycle protein, partial [Desulfitobacteriaceae bacterium]|nr:FtsW/RodA/SpoVE family cell cycle protein [Desulfitobacteriaceae bacterium]
ANMGMVLLGGLAGFAFVHHVQVRFMAWMNPWADVAGKGYQITQSLFAIGAGGFFGTGIGLGQPEYIPEVTTDFIFSAICEEVGVFGGVAVVLLYFILVYRGIKITLNIKDCFHKAVALGISVMLGFQSFIIIGGVIKLIPLTGITLPFISYGGSSLTTSFIALGILQATSFKAVGEEVADAAEIQQENN